MAVDAKLELDCFTEDFTELSIPLPSTDSILDWEIEDILDTCLLLLLLTLLLLMEDFPVELIDVPDSISSKSASIELSAPPTLLVRELRPPVAAASNSSISDEISLAAAVNEEDIFEERAEEETELLEIFVDEILLLSFTDDEIDDERSILLIFYVTFESFTKEKLQ